MTPGRALEKIELKEVTSLLLRGDSYIEMVDRTFLESLISSAVVGIISGEIYISPGTLEYCVHFIESCFRIESELNLNLDVDFEMVVNVLIGWHLDEGADHVVKTAISAVFAVLGSRWTSYPEFSKVIAENILDDCLAMLSGDPRKIHENTLGEMFLFCIKRLE